MRTDSLDAVTTADGASVALRNTSGNSEGSEREDSEDAGEHFCMWRIVKTGRFRRDERSGSLACWISTLYSCIYTPDERVPRGPGLGECCVPPTTLHIPLIPTL